MSLNFSDGYVMGDSETPNYIEEYSMDKQIPGLNYKESQDEDALTKFYINHILK